jgi:hypothetical protein
MSVFPPESPQFEMRHSASSIADFAEPKYMTIGAFSKMTGATFDEAFLISIETHDGRRFVDLESRRAKMLMLRAKYSRAS